MSMDFTTAPGLSSFFFTINHYFFQEIPLSLTQSTIICGGIIIKGITTQKKEREKCMEPMLQKFKFTPYFNKKVYTYLNNNILFMYL